MIFKTKNMKVIKDAVVKHVVSEPGDYTRYDYHVTQFGDEFMFMPYESTFKFPQKIDYWEVKDVETIEDVLACTISEQYDTDKTGISPYTLLECIRTIKELVNEHNT